MTLFSIDKNHGRLFESEKTSIINIFDNNKSYCIEIELIRTRLLPGHESDLAAYTDHIMITVLLLSDLIENE